MTRIKNLGKQAKRLFASEDGAVAPLVGVCIIMLIGAVGVAVDIGRGQVAQSKLQASLDSAGLAAGSMVGQNLDEDLLKPEAQKYLDANFHGSTIDASITDFDLDLSDDESVVTLSAEATLPTTFMRIFGKNQMQVSARSEITREMTGLEVALVVDVTGSMDDPVSGTDSTKKIAALRAAGADLVNILFGSHDEVDDLWVGVVPFSQSVNIGTDHANWMSDLTNYTSMIYCVGPTSGTPKCPSDSLTIATAFNVSTRTNPITRVNRYMDAAPAGWYFKDPVTSARHGWGGCVLERWNNSRDVTDDTPDTQKWQTYFVFDTSSPAGPLAPGDQNNNNWRSNSGNYQVNTSTDISANKGCPQQAITNLTNQKADLLAAINNLVNPRGNTHIPVGAVWGWRLLSPDWRGLWGGDMDSNDLPLEYDEPLSQKAMILMTDGNNTMSREIYTAYGWLDDNHLGTTSETTAVTKLNNKTTAICNAMKAKGVLIYTIVFGSGSNTASKNMMKNCASETDFYFFSPSSDALKTAFKAIGDSLSKLRISR
ncbi:MAG TPA: TadE/TadG family type IV pilus assembly protein [Dongiaceae bacterium]|nr:TadE/TadG family type IV pilus assembly protein [Dongiaceae bacterium]